MISLAMLVVCAGESFSTPGTITGCSLPTNSTCGGRPGEKIRSLTLSDTASICCKTFARFNAAGGGVVCRAGGSSIALMKFVARLEKLVKPPANAGGSGSHLSKRFDDKEGHVIMRAHAFGPIKHVAVNRID